MPSAFVDDAKEIKADNPFESMMERFDEAARRLTLDPNIYKILRWPNREITVHIPVLMDDGNYQVFTGYRVQHNFARGPAKGGIKIHKYLIAIHAPGMILTPILGAMAYNQAADGHKVTGIASTHGAVALITAGTYAASIVAVSWPIHFPHHGAQ